MGGVTDDAGPGRCSGKPRGQEVRLPRQAVGGCVLAGGIETFESSTRAEPAPRHQPGTRWLGMHLGWSWGQGIVSRGPSGAALEGTRSDLAGAGPNACAIDAGGEEPAAVTRAPEGPLRPTGSSVGRDRGIIVPNRQGLHGCGQQRGIAGLVCNAPSKGPACSTVGPAFRRGFPIAGADARQSRVG